jgi:ketosteroid isomerase-like protein
MPEETRMPRSDGTPSPREIFDHVLGDLQDVRLDKYVDRFAPDGVLELPFAPPGVPRRIEGRETIRAFVKGGAARLSHESPQWRFDSVRVHETLDPEVIVTEFDVHGVAGGDPYQFSNLQVMTVRNGEIASLRDYWNPLDRRELAALVDPASPS